MKKLLVVLFNNECKLPDHVEEAILQRLLTKAEDEEIVLCTKLSEVNASFKLLVETTLNHKEINYYSYYARTNSISCISLIEDVRDEYFPDLKEVTLMGSHTETDILLTALSLQSYDEKMKVNVYKNGTTGKAARHHRYTIEMLEANGIWVI